MSARERVYRLINTLDDEKLEALLLLFEDKKTDEFKSNDDIDELMGVFSDCANTNMIPLEKNAWNR